MVTVTITLADGQYGLDSCGAATNLTLAIVSQSTGGAHIDCGGRSRLLTTTGNLAMTGVTVINGRATVGATAADVGGGAVAVVWRSEGNAVPVTRWALITDVAFRDNHLVVDSSSGCIAPAYCPPLYIGGGALSVMHSGSTDGGVAVLVVGCVFDGNSVVAGGGGAASGGGDLAGGGAFVNVTGASVDHSSGVIVDFVDTAFYNNGAQGETGRRWLLETVAWCIHVFCTCTCVKRSGCRLISVIVYECVWCVRVRLCAYPRCCMRVCEAWRGT